ncbi:MAG: threonine ammonia-lyase [Candidatus Lokiarchaeota archaeon]|nr:threonine ammonia-lyase [Candidatus Lokiarchaeota archaeon]
MHSSIQQAKQILKDIAHITPLDHSTTFSKMANGEVHLKQENLQKTGSFKVRGATYAISQLDEKEKEAGVIAASAGNHAQGVAYAASRLGIHSTIVMPKFSPIAKINATRGYGAEVVLHGEVFDEALAHAKKTAEETGATFIHPFDAQNVIAGQGTIGLEILESLPDVDVVAVPVGGGGLISGISIAIKETNPDVEIYGVEADEAAAMQKSLKQGEVSAVTAMDTFCDGIAVKSPAPRTVQICKDLVEDVVTVSELQVSRTIFHLLERAKIVVEPAGAVGLAALQHGKIEVDGRKAVAVLSGGNIDMSMMSKLVSKELFRLGRNIRLKGTIRDRVGVLNKVLEIVAASGVNIVEITHDRSDPDIEPNKAEIILTLEVPDEKAMKQLLDMMKDKGFKFRVYED